MIQLLLQRAEIGLREGVDQEIYLPHPEPNSITQMSPVIIKYVD